MRRTTRSLFCNGLALVLVSLGTGCGATAPPASAAAPPDAAPSDPADASPTTSPGASDAMPTKGIGDATGEVSFRRDVVPLFDASCAFAGCHSKDSYVDLLLGPSSMIAPEQTYQEVLSRPSTSSGLLPLVVPGQPEQSFLYRKLTGNFAGLACDSDGSCGDKMPRPLTPPKPQPSAADIAAVSAWIAMGAQDN